MAREPNELHWVWFRVLRLWGLVTSWFRDLLGSDFVEVLEAKIPAGWGERLPDIGYGATVAGYLFLGMIVMAAIGAWIMVGVVSRGRDGKWAEATIFYELLTLVQMTRNDTPLGSLTNRQEYLSRLDRVARAFRHGYTQGFHSQDPTGSRVIDRFDRVANSFEEYKLWVSVPKADTRTTLQVHLVGALCATSVGHYDLLPVANPLRKPKRSVLRLIWEGARSVVTACIPLAAYVILGILNVEVSEAQQTWLLVFSVAWLAVVVASTLDPLLNNKITVFKEVMSILRSGPPSR